MVSVIKHLCHLHNIVLRFIVHGDGEVTTGVPQFLIHVFLIQYVHAQYLFYYLLKGSNSNDTVGSDRQLLILATLDGVQYQVGFSYQSLRVSADNSQVS